MHSSNYRYWPALNVDPLYEAAIAATERERHYRTGAGYKDDQLPPASYLAISGGGDDGAFAAGIMVGWTLHGDRPEFKVVTGISAGALIAPFVFLGPRYDSVLRDVSVSIGSKDIFHVRGLIRAIFSDAFADDRPLASLIAKYVTSSLLSAVAEQYERGRDLFIGTTDLDSGQAVVWNMGEIAKSQAPGALKLFRQIMLASASIPGVFPPVMIEVMARGKTHQEMHVDGGVTTEVFLFPASFINDITADRGTLRRERDVYVIRNGRVGPVWRSVPRRTIIVGRRALDRLLDAQGLDDLYRLQTISREEHEEFHVAYIGDDFSYPPHRAFDAEYMHRVFDYSVGLAAAGGAWHAALPSVERSRTWISSSSGAHRP